MKRVRFSGYKRPCISTSFRERRGKKIQSDQGKYTLLKHRDNNKYYEENSLGYRRRSWMTPTKTPYLGGRTRIAKEWRKKRTDTLRCMGGEKFKCQKQNRIVGRNEYARKKTSVFWGKRLRSSQ